MYITNTQHDGTPYRPGIDRFSLYKNIWQRHWQGFQDAYLKRFGAIYGPLTPESRMEVRKLLGCGNYRNGFRACRCPDCGTTLITPFTCKSRLCLSCYRKKIFGWSVHLSHILNTGLSHFHVTFTLPGEVRARLFERRFDARLLIKAAAGCYWNELRTSAGETDRAWKTGSVAAMHTCGNGLNYNPHVHMIGTRELVHTGTGEILDVSFIRFKRIRFAWMDDACRLFARHGLYSTEEITAIKERYRNGFHVHFKPVRGSGNDVLFRTAEYLASGYFHNSQILEVNHARRTVTFRYKSWLDVSTKEKTYSTKTMDIYEFMAAMLFYLPQKHQKTVRYYGIYARGAGQKLALMRDAAWACAIAHSFGTDPETCPRCGGRMEVYVVLQHRAVNVWRALTKTHRLYKGYFITMKRGP